MDNFIKILDIVYKFLAPFLGAIATYIINAINNYSSKTKYEFLNYLKGEEWESTWFDEGDRVKSNDNVTEGLSLVHLIMLLKVL